MIDYVSIPDLRCLRCGEITACDTMQAWINREPHAGSYTVGSRFDLPCASASRSPSAVV
ncbi:MAG: hypothetical protein KC420_03895 [Myxococcales bacterium]|nr:hypothetical protein [Myxococcales bacterium]MCB9565772.1 hypothetical protein [Myxococcales bacterium]